MDEARYMIEARPLVFRLMNSLAQYTDRVGINQEELVRAVSDWIDISASRNWRIDRETRD